MGGRESPHWGCEAAASPGGDSGTSVVSLCLKVRTPVRIMRSLLGQHGSGHAISASVDIQSFLAVMRCFAARRGRTAPTKIGSDHVGSINEDSDDIVTERVDRDTLSRR